MTKETFTLGIIGHIAKFDKEIKGKEHRQRKETMLSFLNKKYNRGRYYEQNRKNPNYR